MVPLLCVQQKKFHIQENIKTLEDNVSKKDLLIQALEVSKLMQQNLCTHMIETCAYYQMQAWKLITLVV